jgi:hypothetical protein
VGDEYTRNRQGALQIIEGREMLGGMSQATTPSSTADDNLRTSPTPLQISQDEFKGSDSFFFLAWKLGFGLSILEQELGHRIFDHRFVIRQASLCDNHGIRAAKRMAEMLLWWPRCHASTHRR